MKNGNGSLRSHEIPDTKKFPTLRKDVKACKDLKLFSTIKPFFNRCFIYSIHTRFWFY